MNPSEYFVDKLKEPMNEWEKKTIDDLWDKHTQENVIIYYPFRRGKTYFNVLLKIYLGYALTKDEEKYCKKILLKNFLDK